jgi:uncharacterized cupredoxin-like copper-binding protein
MRAARLLLVPLAAFALLGSACASAAGGDGDVLITLRDFQIDLSQTSVPAGELGFTATNEGPSVHEFEVFSVADGVDAEHLPVSDSVADTEGEGLEVIDEVEDIAPATTASLSLRLEPGVYAIICNLPGHYEKGMHAVFTVE